ncbi:MAG: UDP-4-amino-4,6-dideoxy-N-acetyl-beta-L-altrosamine transaminase [Pseudolabrys sp.]
MIPYSTQDISKADMRAVARVLRSDWLTQGPAVERFERALARYAGTRFAVALSSGTAALHAAYFAAGVTKGDDVIVPALTYAATSNPAVFLGATVRFADIDSSYGTVDVGDVQTKISARTKVIAPVDYGGRPAPMRELRALARKHKILLVADAAHSLGARYRGKAAGSLADMSILSFHPVKSITTGEGGAVLTDNASFADRVRLFRSHGITTDPRRHVRKGHAAWYQEMQLLGYNYRMTDLAAALGESQLRRLDRIVERRRSAAGRYRVLLRDIPDLVLPAEERSYERSAWHLYPVRLAGRMAGKREDVFTRLRDAGIGVQVHYIPVYRHPFYERLGYGRRPCPNAEAFAATEISLPLFASITQRQQSYIARTLRGILKTL